MKASIVKKLDTIVERYEEIERLMSQPDISGEPQQLRDLSKEYAQLERLVKTYRRYCRVLQDIDAAKEMQSDAEMRELALEEITQNNAQRDALALDLQKLLLPQDPHDHSNIFLEIRAGTGGDEAAIFSGDLFKMYGRYAELRKWRIEIISASHGEHGGYKEIIARITGAGAYAKLKFESGAHRVQRIPETESQGRIHTSACTVAVLPELDEIETFDIHPSDLKIDTYRASGAGGQHVNKTDSAVRLTHLPTGVIVACQDERSQHKNKARAMSLLQSKLLLEQQNKQSAERAQTRRNLVGSGDRSERIRTYNFPQGRVTDHRINLTLYSLSEVIAGDLEQIIEPLINEHQADQLAALAENVG